MKYKELVKHMGHKVLVESVSKRLHNRRDSLITWGCMKLLQPRVGWMVGVRWVQTGKIVGEVYYGEECHPSYLFETEPRKLCMMVSWWPTQKPVLVAVDDCSFSFDVPEDAKPFASSGFGSNPQERERQINLLSETMKFESKFFNRDEKGKFIG